MKKKIILFAGIVAVLGIVLIFSRPKLDENEAFKILETARADYGRDNLGGALENFRLLLSKYQSSKFAEESQRFVIYIYEKRQDYTGALNEYRKYLKKFRDTPFTAEFSYKTGFVLYKFLSKPNPARIALMRVIKEYPESEYSLKAKELLAEIFKATGKDEETVKLSETYGIAPGATKATAGSPHGRSPVGTENSVGLNISQMEAFWRLGKHDEAYKFAKQIPKKSREIKESTIYWQLLVKFEPS
ncbi:MAG: outer membrane protein assembly factor BamD, partial [Elusimicrobiota bacterium]|nr:outer membrane protein assembly factor BamD [Elusimicrobiota bacterium]